MADIPSKPVSNNETQKTNAYLVLLFMPLFFCSNIVIGRVVIQETEPFILAFFRWFITGLILLAISYPSLKRSWPDFKAQWKSIFIAGFLGMWICGALVYLALKYTSASNGTLIYTSSSVLIILLEWLFRGRKIGWREIFGVPLAILGVATIVFQGNLFAILTLELNPGDGIFVLTAICWAIYSVLLRNDPFPKLPTLPLIGVVAIAGAIMLFPFAVAEAIWFQHFPTSLENWVGISALVVVSSLFPFTAYQYGVKVVGPATTGVFLYLLPPYGVGLAVLLLGETLQAFHFAGFILILGGVILATAPLKRRAARIAKAAN
ncbi:MAG: DMT family transporter [Hyphomicrobiales bacterium]